MVRFLRLMILSVVVILLTGQAVYGAADITQKDIDEGVSFCRDYPVAFTVDGAVVQPDVPPVIVKERTLVPARAVFEKMGASVSWDEDARMVEVAMGTSKTILTIDSDTAFVNGSPVTMEVPALIIGDRTMIPVRFVGESLACGVDWEPLTRTVMLTSPVIHERTQILSVEVKEKNDYYRVTIEGEGIIEGYKSFAYENPERFGVDIKSAVLEIEDDAVDLDGDMIIGLRYSQFEEDTVRVVVDLDVKAAGRIGFSDDRNSLYIDFNKDQAEEYEELGDVTTDGLDVVDWRATQKLVVIDPGHGGKDTGSQAIRDGVEILNEKDIDIDVATRLNRMLKAAGVSTYMLREADTSLTLYERPALANANNGDLYVSIHNNSSKDNPNARGVEIYYNSKINECDYGIYSKDLAESVYREFMKTVDIPGRGVKSGPEYAVLNKTNMPAIIIEGAFLSNTEDLKLMMTDEFREGYARATAKGIIQILNESVEDR